VAPVKPDVARERRVVRDRMPLGTATKLVTTAAHKAEGVVLARVRSRNSGRSSDLQLEQTPSSWQRVMTGLGEK
jgi:hypothetical protein